MRTIAGLASCHGDRHDVLEKTTLDACSTWWTDITPRATKIRLVQDNLNTHDGANLYETSQPEEACRILDKIEFHYTPKHGSWLNMAETEINVMNRQCLDRQLDSQSRMAEEVAAWEDERNRRKGANPLDIYVGGGTSKTPKKGVTDE